jgi:hypothetical protein
VYEKAGTLSAVRQMQDVKNPAKCAGQAVQGAQVALEPVIGAALPTNASR